MANYDFGLTDVDPDHVGGAPAHRQNQVHRAASRKSAWQEEIDLIDSVIYALRSGIGHADLDSAYGGFHLALASQARERSDSRSEEQEIHLVAFIAQFDRRGAVSS